MDINDNLVNCLWLSAISRSSVISRKELLNKIANTEDLEDLIKRFSSKADLAHIVEEQYDLAGKNRISAVNWLDGKYPLRLRQISGFPLVLYWCGEDPALFWSSACLTVIGTRRATAYGKSATRKIIGPLVSRGTLIISGMARGIDSEAHLCALDKGGKTIAVLGSGPDIIYPKENKDLYQKIMQDGAIISEHPPGTPPIRQYFPARNRILSGLSDCVAVIEASSDSGTMITAGFAGDQGREVFSVPGSIFSPFSSGCNQLIRDGAGILLDAEDLMPYLPLGGSQIKIDEINYSITENSAKRGIPPDIAATLAGSPMTLEQLANTLDTPLPKLASMITRLETEGFIAYSRGRYFLTDAGISCI